jgi:hypothetical protein
MKPSSSIHCFVLLVRVALGTSAPVIWGEENSPPNWKGGGTGTTTPEGGVDVDVFNGKSSRLGQFSGTGFHVLNPLDFTFAGQGTWTAANGDTLDVTYTGQVFFSGDPVFPFGFDATLVANGGTGRFAGAQGQAVLTGAFTGIPGDFFFDFEGTLQLAGD